MKRIILGMLAIVLVLFLLAGCTGSKPPAAPTAQTPTLLERLALVESRLTALEASNVKQDATIATLNTQSNTANLQALITANGKDIAVLQSKLDSIKTQNVDTSNLVDKTSLKTQIDTLQAKIDTLTKDDTDLKKQLADLIIKVNSQPAPTTPTPTSSSSTSNSSTMGNNTVSNGLVSATLVTYNSFNSFNSFFSSNANAPQVLTFTPVVSSYWDENNTTNPTSTLASTGSGTYKWISPKPSQQFQIMITNNTGKTISNIQLALAFQWVDGNVAQVILPDQVTYTLNSMGNPQWTLGSYDQTYASFRTGSANSLLAGFWNFSQNPGSISYFSTLTINLPNTQSKSSALNLPATWYGVPLLKIISYNIN